MPENVKLEDGTAIYLSGLPAHQNGLNGNHTPNQNGTYPTKSVSGYPERMQPGMTSSCCSSKPPAPVVAENGGGSCCTGKATSHSHLETQTPGTKEPDTWNNMPYMNMSHQSPWQNSMPSTQTPYMQSFGMQEPQLPQSYSENYSPNVPTAHYSNLMNGLGVAQSSIGAFDGYSSALTSTPSGDSSYDCKCGDGCQCLGCAAHPFNNTTRQHVQEMGVMMTFDEDEHTPDSIQNSYQTPLPGPTTPTPMNFFMQQPPPPMHAIPGNSFDPYSDPNSTMPSGYSSPIPEGHQLNQQLMHPSEYYTLEYPVGIPSACSDMTGSCQCGNDCSCVGCLTHSGHNGVSLDADLPETPVANGREQEVSPHGLVSSGSARSHNTRIPTLDNISVPCLSPRTFETSMI